MGDCGVGDGGKGKIYLKEKKSLKTKDGWVLNTTQCRKLHKTIVYVIYEHIFMVSE